MSSGPEYEPGQWPEAAPPPATTKPKAGPRGPRWGVRTLAFLSIAALAILLSIEQGVYTIFSLALLLIGFVGAAYCSIRGLIANTGDRGR